jgi:hypothetical protein
MVGLLISIVADAAAVAESIRRTDSVSQFGVVSARHMARNANCRAAELLMLFGALPVDFMTGQASHRRLIEDCDISAAQVDMPVNDGQGLDGGIRKIDLKVPE